MIKLSGNDVTFGENTVSQSGQRMLTKSGIRGSILSGKRTTGFHWNGHRFPPPEPDSVLYLPGYPAQGSTIQDFSGEANDGAITGAVWRRLPSGLWYLSFDGDDDLVTVADSATIQNLTEFTFMQWVNQVTNPAAARKIFDKNKKRINIAGDGTLKADLTHSGGNAEAYTIETVSIDTWYLISLKYSNTGDKKQYISINGVQSTYSSQTATSGTLTADAGSVLRYANDGAANFLNAFMALQRIYTASVSDAFETQVFNEERHLFGV